MLFIKRKFLYHFLSQFDVVHFVAYSSIHCVRSLLFISAVRRGRLLFPRAHRSFILSTGMLWRRMNIGSNLPRLVVSLKKPVTKLGETSLTATLHLSSFSLRFALAENGDARCSHGNKLQLRHICPITSRQPKPLMIFDCQSDYGHNPNRVP